MGLSHAYSCQGEIEQAINFFAKALEIPCAGNINEAKENFIKALTYSNDSKLHEVSTTAAIKAILVNNEIYDKSKTEINAILKFR
jgi:tetratricopeptide (TPR) repeat protein